MGSLSKCVSEMRFNSACYRQNVAYVPEISIFQLRQTHNEFDAFPRRWIKDWFQFVVPVVFLRTYPFVFHSAAEIMLNMFCYAHLKIKEVNKTRKKKKRKRKER